MTDIEQEARDFMNGVCYERSDLRPYGDDAQRENTAVLEAICRALEQRDAERQAHADFRQRVSDEAEIVLRHLGETSYGHGPFKDERESVKNTLRQLIIPKPVDSLVEALREMGFPLTGHRIARELRAACIKHGIPIPDKREEW